jgi:HAMP domain-containing protein
MENKYVVEVVEHPQEDPRILAERLAEAFGVGMQQAEALLRRLPGVVTKAVPQDEAYKVAQLLQEAGLVTTVRAEAPVVAAAVMTEAAVGQDVSMVTPAPVRTEAPKRPAAPPPALQNMMNSGERPAPKAAPKVPPTMTPAHTAAPSRRKKDSATTEVPLTVSAGSDSVKPQRSRRISLRTKFLLVGIMPALLTITAALIAVVFTVQPVLRSQLLETARTSSIAFGSSIGGLVGENDLTASQARAQVQALLDASRADFQAQNVHFVVVTDQGGNQIAGWYGDSPDLTTVPQAVSTEIQLQARRADAREFIAQNNIPQGPVNQPSRLSTTSGNAIEMASSAIQRGGQTIGAVVIGVTDQAVMSRVRSVLYTTSVAGILPVLFAILVAAYLARRLTGNILYLIRSAEQISRGDLSQNVDLSTNDELGDLSKAIERMRVSLEEGLERLRRRRR